MRFAEILDEWAQLALRERWVERWVEGAIFPREMVFLLASCAESGVRVIVESGRQDGYSTELIGIYARRVGGTACSIDLEPDRERADRCRARLSGNASLKLLNGDSVRRLGPVLKRFAPAPSAVLLDGPKGYLAVSMLAAASDVRGVRVLALHNIRHEVTREAVEALGGEAPHFHEDAETRTGSPWAELGSEEIRRGTEIGAARPLDRSTLAVIRSGEAKRLWRTLHAKLSPLRRPAGLRLRWALSSFLFEGPRRARAAR